MTTKKQADPPPESSTAIGPNNQAPTVRALDILGDDDERFPRLAEADARGFFEGLTDERRKQLAEGLTELIMAKIGRGLQVET